MGKSATGISSPVFAVAGNVRFTTVRGPAFKLTSVTVTRCYSKLTSTASEEAYA